MSKLSGCSLHIQLLQPTYIHRSVPVVKAMHLTWMMQHLGCSQQLEVLTSPLITYLIDRPWISESHKLLQGDGS